jgi:RNase H-fold protein (predicted Holliday junction resolvase)
MTRKLKHATPADRAAHRQKQAERKALEECENDEIVRRALETATELTEKDFDVVVIPSGHTDTSAPPDERIQKYAEHLRKVINQAHDSTDESTTRAHRERQLLAEKTEAQFAADPGLRDISNRMCAMCKGGCCADGGNAAYITSATIKREKKRQPGLSDEDLVQAYLSRLSSQTITNACINQTTSGCALPIEMRSDTCNGFHCDTLSAWLDRPREERANTVFAIQRSGTYSERNDLTLPHRVVEVALLKAEAFVPLTVKIDRGQHQ